MRIARHTVSQTQKASILGHEESHFLDLKAIEVAPAKLTRTIAAFVNADERLARGPSRLEHTRTWICPRSAGKSFRPHSSQQWQPEGTRHWAFVGGPTRNATARPEHSGDVQAPGCASPESEKNTVTRTDHE